MTYKPSPKPDYLTSTIIKYAKIKTHLWGDKKQVLLKIGFMSQIKAYIKSSLD